MKGEYKVYGEFIEKTNTEEFSKRQQSFICKYQDTRDITI